MTAPVAKAAAGKVSTTKLAKPATQAAKAGTDVASGQAGQVGRPGTAGSAGKAGANGGQALAGALSGGKPGRGSKALVAEFVICMLILLLSPLTNGGGDVTVAKFMKKGSATAGVFVILGFVSVGGPTARKVASGLGLLMTATILLNERSVFGEIVKAVSGEGISTVTRPAPNVDPDTGLPITTNPDIPGFTFETDPNTGGVTAQSDIAVNRWGAAFGEWITDNFLGGHDDPGQWTNYDDGRKSSGGTF